MQGTHSIPGRNQEMRRIGRREPNRGDAVERRRVELNLIWKQFMSAGNKDTECNTPAIAFKMKIVAGQGIEVLRVCAPKPSLERSPAATDAPLFVAVCVPNGSCSHGRHSAWAYQVKVRGHHDGILSFCGQLTYGLFPIGLH